MNELVSRLKTPPDEWFNMTCQVCGGKFHAMPSQIKKRKTCSKNCQTRQQRAGIGRYSQPSKKDNNHNEIVATLEKLGCTVVDFAKMGNGIPDVLVLLRGVMYLVEIKNPSTSYGRKGLNEVQRDWATSTGVPVYVIRTDDDCLTFVQGDRDSLAFKPTADDLRALSLRGKR
jgi:hypothetical protein